VQVSALLTKSLYTFSGGKQGFSVGDHIEE